MIAVANFMPDAVRSVYVGSPLTVHTDTKGQHHGCFHQPPSGHSY